MLEQTDSSRKSLGAWIVLTMLWVMGVFFVVGYFYALLSLVFRMV
jgi:hypothetical protein